jgi:hypothetical protein
LLGNYSFIDFWSYHLRASSLASEVHALPKSKSAAAGNDDKAAASATVGWNAEYIVIPDQGELYNCCSFGGLI